MDIDIDRALQIIKNSVTQNQLRACIHWIEQLDDKGHMPRPVREILLKEISKKYKLRIIGGRDD